MKKPALFLLLMMFIAMPARSADTVNAEVQTASAEPVVAAPEPLPAIPVPDEPATVAGEAALPTDVPAPIAEPETAEPQIAENLEFISGEISVVNVETKSITVKLYGETEQGANDKILTVTLDDATDITDGEKDRDIQSLTAGTEVDVEYDSSTNKATYIFVY